MNLLLIDVVVALLKETELSHLGIFFKTSHATYEVMEVMSEDELRYRRIDLVMPFNFYGHGSSKNQSHVMKRSDAFKVHVSILKLVPPSLSQKSMLTLEVVAR